MLLFKKKRWSLFKHLNENTDDFEVGTVADVTSILIMDLTPNSKSFFAVVITIANGSYVFTF